MKKINIYSLGVLTLATLGFVGCESEVVEDNVALKKDQPKLETITIKCEPSATTKVAIADGWDMSWVDGEKIAGYSVDSYNQYWADPEDWFPTDYSALYPFEASNANGNSASFTGKKVEDCELRLIYPYDENKGAENFGFDYSIDLATVKVDPTADAYAAAKANMYMVSHDVDVDIDAAEGGSFTMEHLTSYVEWIVSSDKACEITSIELAPSVESSVKITTKAKLNLSEAFDSSDFYSETSHGTYTVDFSTPYSVESESTINTTILPFTFTAGESIDVTVYFTIGGAEYYQTITKTNSTGSDIVFVAGAYNKIYCTIDDTKAIPVGDVEITEAKVQDIDINCAQLSVATTNAVEIGYMIEESEEFDGVAVDATYVVEHKDYKATPDGSVTFTEPYIFDVNYLSPTKEYTIYAYAKDINGDAIITDAIVFNAAALKEVSLTQGAITTTSVSFTPSFDEEYFETAIYDVFLAENDDRYTESFIKSYGTKIYNQNEITVDELEPGKDYIIRLVGEVKVGSSYYYTHTDLAFTTDKLTERVELAGEQKFGASQVSVTSTSYNRNTLVFTNDKYEISYQLACDANYAPCLPVGNFTLFDGSIKDVASGEVIDCIDESTITIEYTEGKYSFMGQMLTAQISDPVAETDNKYLDFYCFDAMIDFPIKIATTNALSIPADNALSFFVGDGQYSSEFGMYLKLDNELSATSVNDGITASAGYLQRYQAGEGNIIVEGECSYNIDLIMFDVAYDSESGVYTLSNGVGETTDGYGFTIEQSLKVDPTNVIASEVAVTLTEITAASGVCTGTGEIDGMDESWDGEYSLSFASAEFDNLFIVKIEKSHGMSQPQTSEFPVLSCTDANGSWSTTDNVTITCSLVGGGDELTIKNSEVVDITKSGDSYSISIKFESTTNNTVYTATYNGVISGYDCKVKDNRTEGGGGGWWY